jgi:hypothetical protein
LRYRYLELVPLNTLTSGYGGIVHNVIKLAASPFVQLNTRSQPDDGGDCAPVAFRRWIWLVTAAGPRYSVPDVVVKMAVTKDDSNSIRSENAGLNT